MKKISFEVDPEEVYKQKVKKRAIALMHRALNDGVLKRPTNCEFCNENGNVQGHHHNYGEPLNVTWLCPKCHAGVHCDSKHPLNPINVEQTIEPTQANLLTFVNLNIKIPYYNFMVLKARCQRLGLDIHQQIERMIRRSFTYNSLEDEDNDDTQYDIEQRIRRLEENAASLQKQTQFGFQEYRNEGNNFRSTVERFYSISARYDSDA